MSSVKVLDFVARELEGRILTVSSVSAFVAAEKAADKLDMTATSREAAELAVLLPKAPLERIGEEFGRPTAEIVKSLRASSPCSGVALEVMALYERSEGNGDRRDAAIAACAAEAAVASEEDRGTLLNALDVMADVETDEARRAFLAELRAGLAGPRRTEAGVERAGRTRMISISMDVCGSTEAKARMKKRARNKQELTRWYEAFHRGFMCLEWRFYGALFQAVPGEAGWDWKHAFVVKGIGDEIWLLYEIGEDDLCKLGSLFARLLHAALEVANCPIYWTSVPHDDEDSGDAPSEAKFLPLKFYIDIIEDAFEVSGPRRDFVTQRLRKILDSEGNWAIEDFIELGNRLHAGSLMADGRRLVTAIRTDYIGWEVDRFFRATKFALPCVVTVGQALFEKVIDMSKDSKEGLGGTRLKKMVVEYPIQQGRGKRFDHCFRYVKKAIGRKDLKGVGEGYAVYRVIRKSDLLKLRHTDVDKAIMKETFKAFTRKMERAVRAELHSRRVAPALRFGKAVVARLRCALSLMQSSWQKQRK